MNLKDLEKNMDKKEMDKFTDMMLEILGSDDDSPMCFRLLRVEKKVHDKTFDLLSKSDLIKGDKFLPLLNCFEQTYKLLEEIEKKIESED